MIDYWCNAFTPDREGRWAAVIEADGLTLRTRAGDDDDGFATAEEMVARMDRLGVATLVVPFCGPGDESSLRDYAHYAARPSEIDAMATAHRGRLVGSFSIAPTAGAIDVDAAAEALDQSWCVALLTHTHSWGLPLDHPDYAPYHRLCAEHGVPFIAQAGASGGRFDHDCGHPDAVDGPASAHPDVPFVLSHTGAPWVTETIEAARRHANVFVGTATHPPRRWPEEIVRYLREDGRGRVLFGTGFPLTGHARSLLQLGGLDLDAATRHDLLEGTARRILTRIPGG